MEKENQRDTAARKLHLDLHNIDEIVERALKEVKILMENDRPYCSYCGTGGEGHKKLSEDDEACWYQCVACGREFAIKK